MNALFTFLAARRQFRSLRGEALARYQNERARSIVDYARAHSPFYRQHLDASVDWRTLPTIDKQSMMASFDTFNTRGVRRDDAMAVALRAERDRNFAPTIDGLTVGLSSGTSGHRGLFLVDEREQKTWAATILARALHRIRRTRLAFFLRSNSNLYQRLGAFLQFRYFDLMTPIDEAVAALNAYQPDLVVGPPSLLALLAAQPSLRITPRRLISVAEVLEPQDAERLRARFGVDVHQIYQCTEGLLAVSCARGALHVQEDVVAVQCEDAGEGRVVPIVTDLHRRIQPIIRYRLNDLLVLAPDGCDCGSAFRVIERIEGRSDDVCHFVQPDGALRAIFPDTLRRAILLAHDAIDDYQITQRRPGALEVRLRITRDAQDVLLAAQRTLEETARQYDCLVPALTVEEGLEPRAAEQKRRRVRVLAVS
ncbi:MAG TPA: F390 synthetase-related protein [Thermoanaerobaculia bacterium]|nr:F390 synthetase-related protein [Thermoanaerobaculia bacterium]